jgi:hypothetical protein
MHDRPPGLLRYQAATRLFTGLSRLSITMEGREILRYLLDRNPGTALKPDLE